MSNILESIESQNIEHLLKERIESLIYNLISVNEHCKGQSRLMAIANVLTEVVEIIEKVKEDNEKLELFDLKNCKLEHFAKYVGKQIGELIVAITLAEQRRLIMVESASNFSAFEQAVITIEHSVNKELKRCGIKVCFHYGLG